MKTTILNRIAVMALLLNFICIGVSSAQSFEWAKRAGLWAFDLGYGIGTDDAGNVYISGKYEMNAYFGGTTVGCAGNHDIYTAKYGPDGSFKWVRTAGGKGGDYTHASFTDGAGNTYITGEIEMTVKFVGTSVTLTSNGDNDIFVAKYNANGDLMWAKKLGGGSRSDKGLGISVVGSSVYITGKFESTGNFAGTTLSSAGGYEMFLAKYTTDGVFQWAKRAGGSGNDEGYAVTNDPSGNVYVTGYFSGTANFGGIYLTSSGGSDAFIAKYNSAGGIIWAKKAGGGAMDYGMGIKADAAGRIFWTGGFRTTSNFGGISLKAPGGNANIFVACYNSSGGAIWAKSAGGYENDYGRAIAIDASGNSYITGNFGNTATFGSTTITGVDATELYFASYDVNGNFRWVLKAGGVVDKSDPDRFIEMGLSIAVDRNRNVFASGTYRSASTFGATTLQPWDHTEIFITKIRQSSARLGNESTPEATLTPTGTVSLCSGGSVQLKASEHNDYSYVWKKDGKVIKDAKGYSHTATSQGSYTVTLISGKDSVTSDPTVISETNTIVASVYPPGPIAVCGDSTITLHASEGYGYIYQWKRNGEIIKGANSSEYVAEKSGDYQVKIIQGSCFDWSGNVKLNLENELCKPDGISNANSSNLVTGITETTDDSLLIKIIPNPNNGLFTMEVNMAAIEDGTAGNVKVEVINSVGQIVYYRELANNSSGNITQHIELDGNISTGIYFLQVTVGNKVEKTRMMLTK